MRSTPEALRAQALAARAVATAARRYFEDPSDFRAEQARQKRLDARATRAGADAAIEREAGSKADWLELSAALADFADETGWCVEEHRRFSAPIGAVGTRMTGALDRAAQAIAEAIGRPEKAETALAEAKHRALEIEDIRRTAGRKARTQPVLAAELSAQAVLEHFSKAAETVHRAADALAARLGESA